MAKKIKSHDETIVAQLFMSLLPAQIFASVASSIGGIINGIVIGNSLSPISMVALGFVGPLNSILAALSIIVAGGARVLCSRYMGTGETAKINRAFSVSLVMITVMGIILTAAGLGLATGIASILGATGDGLAETAVYIRGLSVGFLFAVMAPCLMTFLQLGNDSYFALLTTFIMAALNLVLTLLFIKVFNMGIFGAGLSVSISQFAAVIIMAVRFRKNANLVKYQRGKPDGKLMLNILAIGFPAAFLSILYPLRNIVFNSLANTIGGENAVGALAVLYSAAGPYDAVNIGISATSLMLLALAVGERNEDFFKDVFRYTVKIGMILAAGKVVLYMALGGIIAKIFGAEGDRLALSASLLRFYSLSVPVNMVTIVLLNSYQALGKLKAVNIINVLSAFLFPVGFSFALKSVLGIESVWLAFSVADALTILTFYIISIFRNRRFPTDIESLVLPGDMLKNGHSIVFNISSLDEIAGVAEKIQAFLQEQGLGHREAMIGALSMEETARNIVTLCFPKAKKNRDDLTVNVFALKEEDEVLLRLRDNGPPFDQKSLIDIHNPDDPTENIGVRMVAKLSRSMNYMSTFGMNVLNIHL